MYTAYSMNVRKSGTTFEQYKDYLENTHVPFLIKLWGKDAPLRYTRSYTPVEGPDAVWFSPESASKTWRYDCITRLDFEDQPAFQRFAALFTKHGKEIAEDEARFMDREKTEFVVVGQGCWNDRSEEQ